MRVFKDGEGRPWVVAVNVTAIKRVRAHLEIDLYALLDGDYAGLDRLLKHPVDLVNVVYVLCMDEAGKRGVSDEDFGRAMYGDAILSATDAFTGELADFFPDPRRREALRKVLAKAGLVTDRILERLDETIEAIDPDRLANDLIVSSGSAPESSDLTPGRSPSAN